MKREFSLRREDDPVRYDYMHSMKYIRRVIMDHYDRKLRDANRKDHHRWCVPGDRGSIKLNPMITTRGMRLQVLHGPPVKVAVPSRRGPVNFTSVVLAQKGGVRSFGFTLNVKSPSASLSTCSQTKPNETKPT